MILPPSLLNESIMDPACQLHSMQAKPCQGVCAQRAPFTGMP